MTDFYHRDRLVPQYTRRVPPCAFDDPLETATLILPFPNLRRRRILVLLAAVALAGSTLAQAQDLPSAPSFKSAAAGSMSGLQLSGWRPSSLRPPNAGFLLPQSRGSSPSGVSPEEREASPEPVTMFRHPDSVPYFIAGQANIIFQAHPGFHSPYQGPNSFRNGGEYKTSMIVTLYLAYQPIHSARFATDFILDVESAGGRGLSEALGLAGFTNLDVVRNPNLGSAPYLARYQVHQVLGLTTETAPATRGPFALSTDLPVRRFELRAGKMSVVDTFDLNAAGSDSHLQFTNWAIDNNGAYDYAADTRGYTTGAILEYDDRRWSARYGVLGMPTVANGITIDYAFRRARGQNAEFELRRSPLRGRAGTYRLLSFINTANMGTYRDSIDRYLAGVGTAPSITSTRREGTIKYGFGFNFEQALTQYLRVFGRFGWNEGQKESFAYTEIDQTFLFGADYQGGRWHRPIDKLGLAVVTNAIKRDHQEYLALGGLGFLLGDGRLNYAREDIEEGYYTLHTWRGLFFSLGLTHIDHPGYNQDRGPVWVPSVRGHVDF